MKVTEYFLSTRQRRDREWIKFEWIQYVIDHPVREEIQSDGRIRRWARIGEAGNKYLRVILLEDGETVHNAFFDILSGRKSMDIKYFSDTDTLLIDFTDDEIVETKDINENILIELDSDGALVSMTIEHAKKRMDVESFSYQKVAASE